MSCASCEQDKITMRKQLARAGVTDEELIEKLVAKCRCWDHATGKLAFAEG